MWVDLTASTRDAAAVLHITGKRTLLADQPLLQRRSVRDPYIDPCGPPAQMLARYRAWTRRPAAAALLEAICAASTGSRRFAEHG